MIMTTHHCWRGKSKQECDSLITLLLVNGYREKNLHSEPGDYSISKPLPPGEHYTYEIFWVNDGETYSYILTK